ncbi:hypothetical protein QE439_001922 [Pedobacter agri]|nr:hypothetical protein [Pedobacter agri]
MLPNNHPPIGRIKNPTAKIPAVLSNCAVGLLFGKNIGEKYKANAEYVYQSYHSTKLPTEPPKIDLSLYFTSFISSGLKSFKVLFMGLEVLIFNK